jgi:hypothetical protein
MIIMISKVDNDYNLVSYDRKSWDQFPPPGKKNTFTMFVGSEEYFMWKRNLKSRCTSFAKIFDSSGKRITHRDFCFKHGLRKGTHFNLAIVKLQKAYRFELMR